MLCGGSQPGIYSFNERKLGRLKHWLDTELAERFAGDVAGCQSEKPFVLNSEDFSIYVKINENPLKCFSAT